MVDPERQDSGGQASNGHMTKKCPECYAYMSLEARVCPACKKKVGEVDALGFAKKPFDWRGYVIGALCITAFVVFMWWGFFREQPPVF